MPVFQHRSRFDTSVEEVFAWHMRPGALERLLPPWSGLTVASRQGGIHDGGRVSLERRLGPFRVGWTAEHRDWIENRQFVDVQIDGPFRSWTHTHRFEASGPGAAELEDHIEYAFPLSGLGERFVHAELARQFAWRERSLAADLALHRRHGSAIPRNVVIGGASGLVGRQLAALLGTGGHRVRTLVRGRPGLKADPDREIVWDPASGELDPALLEGVDAVVNLSGASIAAGRWSARRKRLILGSRVQTTRVLSGALARMKTPPRVLVSASAVGIYGDRSEAWVSESSEPGTGFLAEVCEEWESATRAAADAGIRVVHARLGVVLSARGGALATMMPPFRMGAGGILGSGRQYMSWISIDDAVAALQHLILTEGVEGPVNLVAPEPVTNRVFTRTIGRVIGRPTFLPLPARAVKLIFGEMGTALFLEGARVGSQLLEKTGFRFRLPTLEEALRSELGREAEPD